jgi:hypothetical protein
MLKNIRKIASNVYKLPRREETTSRRDVVAELDGVRQQLLEPDAIDDAVLTSRPTRFEPPLFTKGQSVKAFFDELMEYGAGGKLKVKYVELSYKQLAIERRWAPVSMKFLSSHLVAMGCKRKRIGPDNETYLVFPLAKGDTA